MSAGLRIANDAVALPVRKTERAGVMLHSVEDAMTVVSALGDCNLLPDGIKSQGDAFMIVMAGAELGMGPMASIRSLHIIKGKVTMSAELILGMLLSQGVKAKWVTSTNDAAELELTRPGSDPHRESFTMEDAQRAQLLGNGSWKKYPKAMLRARCISAAARAYAPDLMAGGGVYTPDELEVIDGDYEEQPRQLSAVQADVRADDPERFDAAMEAHDKERADAEHWYRGQVERLEEMSVEGKRLAKTEPTEDERDAHLGELASLNEELTQWVRLYAADYIALNTKAGKNTLEKVKTRLRHAAEACGIPVSEMKRMIREAADAIESNNGEDE